MTDPVTTALACRTDVSEEVEAELLDDEDAEYRAAFRDAVSAALDSGALSLEELTEIRNILEKEII